MNKNPFRFMPQISCQIQSDKICVFLKKDLPKKKKKKQEQTIMRDIYKREDRKIPEKTRSEIR